MKTYKFRIYPNEQQSMQMQKIFGCTRFVYNYYLAMRKKVYEESKETFNFYDCALDMTKLKKDHVWLFDADSSSLQSSLKNLDGAFNDFFRRVKKGKPPGYPKFKSKKEWCKSYTSKNSHNNIRMSGNYIRMPKVGLVKCAVSRMVEGRILSATVSQNPSGKYFVSVSCTDVDIKPFEKTGAIAGIDLGLKELAITSDGQHFQNPKYFVKSQKKLAKLQRELSRKPKGSANREKARIKVARLHEHIANQRLDSAHKMTTALVRDYDLIATETLMSKNMMKNHKLAKAISDVAWSEIIRQLAYKCEWYGKEFVKIDMFYPSSQTCNSCGFNINSRKSPCFSYGDIRLQEFLEGGQPCYSTRHTSLGYTQTKNRR